MNKQPQQHSHDSQFSTPSYCDFPLYDFPRPVRALPGALT